MLEISGYRMLKQLGSNGEICLYQMERLKDQQSLIVKTTSSNRIKLRMSAVFQYEYEQFVRLKDVVLEPITLEYVAEQPILYFKDTGGSTLHQILKIQRPSLKFEDLLEVAIAICDCVSKVHENQVILNEMTPLSFFLNDRLTTAKIVDLRYSSNNLESRPLFLSVGRPDEVLPYLSPEHLGRSGKTPDYRSDIYSLGVILYEWFGGGLPFQSDGALDLVHLHLTANAKPLHLQNPSVPKIISEIIQKCIEKMPENRYASVKGLRLDLEECRSQFRILGKVRPFSLATRDRKEYFDIPSELLERPIEKQKLIDALQRTMNGSKEAVLVTGEMGIEKTSFVLNTLRNTISMKSIFAFGSSSISDTTVRQPIWIQMMEELIGHLLTLNETKLENWQKRISYAIHGNEKLLTHYIPRLELIIGQQVGAFDLLVNEAEKNLPQILKRFLQVFIAEQDGLILFFDGLEKADDTSIQLLRILLEDDTVRSCMIIMTVQDEKVLTTAAYQDVRNQLDKRNLYLQCIRLENWGYVELKEKLSLLLTKPIDLLEDLSSVIYRETKGNPLYVKQFLNEAVKLGMLNIDEKNGTWRWDIDRIRVLNISRKDEPHLLDYLGHMSEETAYVLAIAACLGKRFTVETIANVTGFSDTHVMNLLKPALEEGYIQQSRDEKLVYIFRNDNLREAVYERLSGTSHHKIHREIGLLLEQHRKEGENIQLTEVLRHLNIAADEVMLRGEASLLAALNLQAGVMAKQSGDLETALYYLKQATSLLEDSWISNYGLTWQAFRERSEAEFLCGRFNDAKELFQLLLKQATTDYDKAQACIMLARLEMNREQYEQVIVFGEMALKLLGLPLTEKTSDSDLKLYHTRVKRLLREQLEESLEQLPFMTDMHHSAAMSALQYLSGAYALLDERKWLVTVFTMIEVTLTYGLTSEAVIGFANYARFLHDYSQNYKDAHNWATLSCKLSKSNAGFFIRANTAFLQCHESWSRFEQGYLFSFPDSIYKNAIAVGDYWYAHYSMLVSTMLRFQYSQPLEYVSDRLRNLASDVEMVSSPKQKRQTAMLAKMFVSLTGGKEIEGAFSSYDVNEDTEWIAMEDEVDPVLFELHTVYQYMTGYLFGKYEQARVALEKRLQMQNRIYPALDLLCHEYYYALVLKETALIGRERKWNIKKLYGLLFTLKRLAKRSPESHIHQYFHIRAEIYSVKKRVRRAKEFYEKALEAAKKKGHLRDAAIIAECYAKFGISTGNLELARYYMHAAHDTYIRWGAILKAEQLQENFGDLLYNKYDVGTNSDQIDYLSVAMSVQAMSSEMEMGKLLPRLMKIMLQNAGADYGAIIIADGDEWRIEAYGTLHELSIHSILLNEESQLVPFSVISYADRTREAVMMENASSSIFERDRYIRERNLKSLLCLPIVHQGQLISFIYLENNQSTGVFTKERLEVLQLLGSQCAISITNVKLYTGIKYLKDNLEEQVEERTFALKRSMKATSEALAESTVYAERIRIAQEIHDIVGHSLTSTILQIEAAKRLLHKDMDASVHSLKETQNLIRHSLNEIRNSVHMLREDRYYDLNDVLNKLIHDTTQHTEITIHAHIDELSTQLSMLHKKAIYHALQEGLTNGMRHGKSSEFWFSLFDIGGEIVFSLKDNGIGFSQVELGFGLTMMKERIEQLGGILSIESSPSAGCHIQITIPY